MITNYKSSVTEVEGIKVENYRDSRGLIYSGAPKQQETPEDLNLGGYSSQICV